MAVIAGGKVTAALDQVMFAIESGSGKIIIDRMDLKTGIAIYRCFRPLPDIADHIVKFHATGITDLNLLTGQAEAQYSRLMLPGA